MGRLMLSLAALVLFAATAVLASAAAATKQTRHISSTNPALKHVSLSINEPDLCAPDVQQYSGYIDIDEETHYFFWFFESRNDPRTDPFVSFHNGGPGCSSMVGLLAELIGPCTINADMTETPNPYTWISNASMIFIDAPAGAGYSYTEGNMTINTVQYAEDVYSFFQLFFTEFPQYQPLDFHLFGESYAGHYIPALAARIVEGNKEPTSVQVNLKSIAPGNALVDPLGQYPFYPQMACNNSYGIMLVEQEMCDFMQSRLPLCLERIEKCYDEEAWAPCVWSGISCNYQQLIPAKFNRKDLNLYDIRIPCETGNLCYDFSAMEDWLRTPEIQLQLLGETGHYWRSCNYRINLFYQLVGADWMRPYVREVQPLLDEAGIKVLVFSGDADYIVNWYGSESFTRLLSWSGGDQFRATPLSPWIVNGQPAGQVRSYGGLTFLRVFEAGHMVPMDQPVVAKQMFLDWINNVPFN